MKRALVTGGSGAVGRAICKALAQQGIHVVIHTQRQVEAATALRTEIEAQGGSAEVVRFDVTDAEVSVRSIEALLAREPIQILISNAGIHSDAPMAGMRGAEWRAVIDVSLNGFFNVTQPLLLPMMSTRWGRIVALSSVAGVIGNRGQANYAAAKSGLHGACKSLALELATRGVTVNVVAPGIIESPMTSAAFNPAQIEALVPMKRAGTPEEVAALVGFLTSEHAGYITGQVIGINGGII
jgi:3-oxoacyl-[acyl-carrier protein] reductase